MRSPLYDSSIGDSTPFFTVLIPTMNRPQLLECALASVHWQSFNDFEVVVSDNSDSEECLLRNQKTLGQYSNDQRVRYLRPPHWMSMPDHWEFASCSAAGKYVLILTDRFVMRPSALARLRSQIAGLDDEIEVISWDANSSYSQSGQVHSSSNTGGLGITDSKELVQKFARCDQWAGFPLWVNRLPRMLNSCYRSNVAARIRKEYGRLFLPTAPDYTAGFMLLANTTEIAYFDCPLYISHGGDSNGQKALIRGVAGYVSTLGNEEWLSHAPTSLQTVTNYLVRDFLTVKTITADAFKDAHIDLVGYFMSNFRELLQMERLGSQCDLGSLFRQWRSDVKSLPVDQQNLIDVHLKTLLRERARFVGLRRMAVSFGLEPIYHWFMNRIRRLGHRVAGRPVYENVLAAAMATDSLIISEKQVP